MSHVRVASSTRIRRGRQSNEHCAGRGGSRYPFPCGEERGGFLLVEIDRQFFDEMINRFNNNNIKIDRI